MTDEKIKVLEQFLGTLMDLNYQELSKSTEGKLRQNRENQLMEYLDTCLNAEGKEVVQEVLEELNGFSASEMSFLYQQGFLDCVFLLKQLKIIA